MATYVTEVVGQTDELHEMLETVVGWFCGAQGAFRPELLKLSPLAGQEIETLTLDEGGRLLACDIFQALRSEIERIKGAHDRVIFFTDKRLDGSELSNLFSSVEEDGQGGFTGLAAVTTWDVERLTGGLPIEAYLVQQLVSINIRWVVGEPMLHEEVPTDCLFHKRLNKRLIALAVKEMRLCDKCRDRARALDDSQWQSLKDAMHEVSKAVSSETPRQKVDELLASRKADRFGLWDWRDPSKTLPQDVIDLWRRFRRGRTKYAVGLILALGGVALIDPPWWEALLLRLIGLESQSNPSQFQQVLGVIVILLAVLVGARTGAVPF